VRNWLLCSVVGLAAVWIATSVARRTVAPENAAAISAAAAIAVGAAIVALGPPAVVARRFPDQLGMAGMGAMLVRLFLTLFVGWWYLRSRQPPKQVFLNALVVSYLVCLTAETLVVVRLVQKHWRPPGKDADASRASSGGPGAADSDA